MTDYKELCKRLRFTREPMPDIEIFKLGLEAADAIDELTKKGKWIYPFETTTLVAECSECGSRGSGRMNYCPNCGAKMEGE